MSGDRPEPSEQRPSERRLGRARQRYLSLGLGELTAAALGIVLAVGILPPYFDGPGEKIGLWSALGPLLLILLHAGVYWLLARSQLGRPLPTLPRWFARRTRNAIAIHPILLLAGFGGLIATFPHQPFAIGFAVIIWVLGVLEYINYFIVRISYPWYAWTAEVGRRRTPRLIKDVRSSLR